MRTILILLQKEFRQIFRSKILLFLIIVLPVMQLIILPKAANYEVRHISIAVVDQDHSTYTQKLVSKITASGYFRLVGYHTSFQEAFEQIETDKADLVLEFPAGFERTLVRENEQKVFIAVNAINGAKANLGAAYLGSIIRDFNAEIRLQWNQPSRFSPMPVIEIASANWYNPLMRYQVFMVPGIMAILVTLIGMYLTALNIVKEKEIGTIEQINVTPIRKHHFILGKLIPFWFLGNVIFTIGMLVAWRVYAIVPLGSIGLLYGFLAVYQLAVLGLGLLISTYSDTQQQAMFIAFFFMMVFILMGGLFTTIDSMPEWAKWITRFNPVSYFIEVMRMVVLKGSGFAAIKFHFLIIGLFAVVLNAWAIMNYKKTS
jgi:ABC-2 type transport system permease protein